MRVIVLLALLAGCIGSTSNPSEDGDGDGFSVDDGDCNDDNTGIFPGATERCDGIDSDCDGSDAGGDLTGATTFYEDLDGDSFGADDTGVSACESPGDGWTEQPGDCAPDEAARNPGADEVCDGVDNNCSGTADDGLPDVFADMDGDGFGDPVAIVDGCETGANRVANDEDCDDTDADVTAETIWYFDTDEDGFGIDEVTEVSCTLPGGDYAPQGGDCRPDDADGYPGAVEICDNGQQAQNIDDNCNGQIDEGCDDLVSCDTITTDTTWSGELVIPCDIVVEGTPMPTLTIADGTTVRFGAGRSLIIGRLDLGRLVVEGDDIGVTITSDGDAPEAGDWSGLVVDNAPGSTLTGLTLEYAGADRAALILAADDTEVVRLSLRNIEGTGILVEGESPTITDLTAMDVSGAVVECAASADVSITNATVSNAGSPMVTHLDCADAYRGDIDFSELDESYVTVSGVVISQSATWSNVGVPYRLTQGATVAGSDEMAVWTLDPGVVVEVADGERVTIGAAGHGQLVAVGTADEPIVFTSASDSPLAGDWTGVVVQQEQSTSTLVNVEILYSGFSDVFDAGLYISGNDAAVVAEELHVAHGAADGITVWNGTLSLSSSEIRGNAGDGLAVGVFGDLVEVSSTVFADNGGAARFANSDAITNIANTTSFAGNTDNRLRISDMTLERDSDWGDLGVPYLIETNLTVASTAGTDLTLTDAVVQFGDGVQLQIGLAGGQSGTLAASGVEFRGEGADPGAGFWNGIALRGDSSIINSVVRQAGNTPNSAVDLFGGSGILTGNTFEEISGSAITCWPTSGPHTISGNTFVNVDLNQSGCD